MAVSRFPDSGPGADEELMWPAAYGAFAHNEVSVPAAVRTRCVTVNIHDVAMRLTMTFAAMRGRERVERRVAMPNRPAYA